MLTMNPALGDTKPSHAILVALSSCESEFMAATGAAYQALWLKRLLSELTGWKEERITLKVDNISAIALVRNPFFHGKSKHIDIRCHFIHECVENGHINVEHVSGELQRADILTKALPRLNLSTCYGQCSSCKLNMTATKEVIKIHSDRDPQVVSEPVEKLKAMKIKHYLRHTDFPIWEVIQKGNGLVHVSTDTNGQIRVLPPKTAEEILARERERKARTTLLMSIPEDHLAKFHKITYTNEMWEAIKSKFGENNESKKMRKYILKKQFKSFSISNSEGLYKGYDMFQSLLSQLEIHGVGVDTLSFDDLYNNLRVFKSDVKGSTASSSSTQNVAFVSSDSTRSTNEVSTAYGVSTSSSHNSQREGSSSYTDELMYSFFANQSSGPQLDHEDLEKGTLLKSANQKEIMKVEGEMQEILDTKKETMGGDLQNKMNLKICNSGSDTKVTSCLKECKESYAKLKKLYDEQREQLGDASIEIQAYTLALKKIEAQLVCHQKNQLAYEEKIRFMKIDLDDKTNVLIYHKKLLAETKNEKEELKTKLENFQSSSKGLSKLLNSQMSAKDKSRLGYRNQIHEKVLSYENKVLENVFDSRSSDVEDSHVNDRFVKVKRMHAVPPSITGIYMPPKFDFRIDESKFTYGPKQFETGEYDAKTNDLASCESNFSVETLKSVPKPVESKPKAVSEHNVWSDA
nr:ribonuclease H-like domain, reverse transcriptase, RNA-dependent DNA polymerase [Tanacetum cinerariifolium]